MAFNQEIATISEDMKTAIAKMFEMMIADYNRFMPDNERMQKEYAEGLSYTSGVKYIKIISGNSVCAFIVNCTNDKKFKYGDILKPAGWQGPARNAARGNVLGKYHMNWTGTVYLR